MERDGIDGRMIFGVLLIVLGAMFLFGISIGWLWPLFIIVPGLLMFVPVFNRPRASAALAIPASIVTGTGLILLYQNTFNHWGSWAYIWTLYGVVFGFGTWLMGRNRSNSETQQHGRRLMVLGAGAFVVLWLFFEAIGFIGWPLLLILLGGWLLLRATGRSVRDLNLSAFSASPRHPAASTPKTFMEEEEAPLPEPREDETVAEVVAPIAPAGTEAPDVEQLNDEVEAAADVAEDISDRAEDSAAVQRDLDEDEAL